MVPVVYHGARECLPYGEWRVRAGSHIQVVLCEAIDTRGKYSLEDRFKLTEQLRRIAERETNRV